MTPSADFICPGCKARVTLHWPSGQSPPADEGCDFCDVVEPLRRDWSPIGVGPVPGGGGSPSRVCRPSRV